MKSLKKVIKISVMILIIFIIPFAAGCSCVFSRLPSREEHEIRIVGDFEVCFYIDHCEIMGTTEQGNSKKYLIIPEYIDGIPVKSFGLYSGFFGLTVAQIDSNVLEKVYFEAAIEANKSTFSGNNIKKIMYPKVTETSLNGFYGVDTYFPIKDFIENELNEGYGIYGANVSYCYNYENTKSEYYWIDDCDYGSKIEFIPPNPEREGYTFGGWYKEEECINTWDFDSDTLPEEKTELKEYSDGNVREEVVYQETILYAKWELDLNGGEK